MEFKRSEVKRLLEFFDEKDGIFCDNEMTVTVVYSSELNHPGKGFPNYGLHAHYTEYPEEGLIFLGRDNKSLE